MKREMGKSRYNGVFAVTAYCSQQGRYTQETRIGHTNCPGNLSKVALISNLRALRKIFVSLHLLHCIKSQTRCYILQGPIQERGGGGAWGLNDYPGYGTNV